MSQQKQTYHQVTIRRDAVETVTRDASTTEIPVLQAVYGDSMTVGAAFIGERAETSPEEEYDRLAMRYGEEAMKAGYGPKHVAVREIADLFRESRDAARKASRGQAAKIGRDPFLLQSLETIADALPELSDERLVALIAEEKSQRKPNKDVLAALEDEVEQRQAEDESEQQGASSTDTSNANA